MTRWFHLLPAVLLWPSALALAQTYALDAFRELRRRLDEGRETTSLAMSLAKHGRLTVGVAPSESPHRIASQAVRGASTFDVVRLAACRNGVPPDLALAVVDYESRFRNDALGAKGEIGAAQILPATARAYGFDITRLRKEFAYNVEAAMEILRDLSDRFGENWTAVLRAYNGGPNLSTASPEAQIQTARYAGDIQSWRSQYDSRCR